MYYYFNRQRSEEITRIFLAVLILSIFFITFQTNVFADTKEKSIEEYRLKGYKAQQESNLEQALSFYAKAAYISPSPAIYNDMGVIYEQLGLSEKAEQYYLQAIQLDSHYLPAYSNLAYLYEKEGDLEKAAEYFKKRIAFAESDDLWTEKAKQRLSRIGDTLPHIKQWVMQQDARDLNRKLTRQAREAFQERVQDANKLFKEGWRLAKAKKYRQAILKYDKALALTPENPKIVKARDRARLEVIKQDAKRHTDNALKMLNLGDTTSAKIEFRKILTIIPDEPIRISE